MNKTTHLLLLTLIISGCYIDNRDNTKEDRRDIKVQEQYTYTFSNDIPTLNTVQEACAWTKNHLKSKLEEMDYWQTPEESYLLKTGDCEDHAILLLYICWEMLNITDCYMVRILEPDGSYHVIAQVEGQYWETTNGNPINSVNSNIIQWVSSYPEIIWMTLNYHDSVGKYY